MGPLTVGVATYPAPAHLISYSQDHGVLGLDRSFRKGPLRIGSRSYAHGLGTHAESRIEIAAQALGNAEGAFLKALAHAKSRTQFGRPILDFQGIGHKIARMWSQIQSAKWATYHAAWICDHPSRKMESVVPLYT